MGREMSAVARGGPGLVLRYGGAPGELSVVMGRETQLIHPRGVVWGSRRADGR